MLNGAATSSDDKWKLAIMSDDIAKKARKYIEERSEQLNGITDATQHKKAFRALKQLSDALGPLLSDKDKVAWGYKESSAAFSFEQAGRDNSVIHERNNERSRDDDHGR